MILNRAGDADSFGERLRHSRQRLRTSLGRRWTQGDLAEAVGVERNTVSRWENGGILPKDPAVLAALARTLRVSTDWLLDGLSAATGVSPTQSAVDPGSALHEGADSGYRPDARALAKLPPAAGELVRVYLTRMANAGCSTDQLKGAESILLAGATHAIARRTRDEAEILADVDAAWDFVTHVLRREGIRP